MQRAPLAPSLVWFLAIAGLAAEARADGKRDLEDGVAFYENLDTDRALERLQAASRAPDLDASGKAKAFLYLGMLHYELGRTAQAHQAWGEALKLSRDVRTPPGTSPKTIEALEQLRASRVTPPVPSPAVEPKRPAAEPKPPAPVPPAVEPDPKPPALLPEARPSPPAAAVPPPREEGGGSTWLWAGIGGAVAVAAAVAVVVFATGGGSECERGGGGCLAVTLR